MATENNRIVYPTNSGNWANKKIGNTRPTKLFETQKEAINSAYKQIKDDGGGELTIIGKNHKIRQKTTVPNGNDPCPPKDNC